MTRVPRRGPAIWKLLLGAVVANLVLWAAIVSLVRHPPVPHWRPIGCDQANRWCGQ